MHSGQLQWRREIVLENKNIEPDTESKGFSVSSVYAKIACANRMWFFVSVILLVINVLSLLVLLNEQNQMSPQIVVLDKQGNYIVGRRVTLKDCKQAITNTAVSAAEGIFSQNERGFENEEKIMSIFSKEMQDKIKQERKKHEKEFQDNQFIQKCQINNVTIKKIEDAYAVIVVGQVYKHGKFNGDKFMVSSNFELKLKMYSNESMIENEMYPFIVKQYLIKLSQVKGEEGEKNTENKDE